MTRDPGLDTGARRRALAGLRELYPNPRCHLCNEPIDMTLPRGRHPLSWTADDLVPRIYGGNPNDLSNLLPAHLTCNSTRQERRVTNHVRAQCRASFRRHAGQALSATRRW